jgi:hypothetical protein
MTEDFKCGGRFWIKGSCWPPADTEKLLVKIDAVTSTLVDCNMMDAVGVGYPEVYISGKLRGARTAICMSQLYPEAKVPQCCPLKKEPGPHLPICSVDFIIKNEQCAVPQLCEEATDRASPLCNPCTTLVPPYSLYTDIVASAPGNWHNLNGMIRGFPMPCIHPDNHLDNWPKWSEEHPMTLWF